jgi:hypothetical protein
MEVMGSFLTLNSLPAAESIFFWISMNRCESARLGGLCTWMTLNN